MESEPSRKVINPSFNHNRVNTLHTCSTVEHVEVDEVELDVWMKMQEEARLDVIVDEGVGKTTMMQGNSRSRMGVLAKGTDLNDLMESKGGKKKSSSSKSFLYEAPLDYIIEDVRPHGGIKKFRSAAYSNCIRKPS
ncbi:hypothetical protein D0Y65_021610 [Glycine soja]|uniref:Uncharacterized protein n=1 Tax=Glycine soja TaxID=3848 RepID=A0A445JK94_GLYSO|nr:hypothetical protein D0Y65_021610 [Glycine soja]